MNSRLTIIVFFCVAIAGGCRPGLDGIKKKCSNAGHLPHIRPDYTAITIPPNIAPLNFSLKDSVRNAVAEITSVYGSPIVVRSTKGGMRINAASWKKLLMKNTGNPLYITVYARTKQGGWQRYETIKNGIAAEPIDRYCTYRLLNFQYRYWKDLRMCQRDLTSFAQTTFLNSLNYTKNNMRNVTRTDARTSATRPSPENNTEDDPFRCVNCHLPVNNDPERFTLQLRSNAYGAETLIGDGDSITKVSSRFGQAAWHPGGRIIAFSVYDVKQCFHTARRQVIDVYDKTSRIVIYDIAERKIIPVPQFNRQNVLEGWPAWSPDGSYLYYCGAPVPWNDYSGDPPVHFNKTRYSLLRISYDPVSRSWGTVDTVLSTMETGLSIAQPRLSPDNRFCLFCMQNYGPYAYIDASSDLYLMDLATRRYRRLQINSEYNESWHSWSSDGRWILFSSRRDGGILTRLYICHIDSTGIEAKPFILPQRDPRFYDAFLKCYNVAELATAPVRFSERKLLRAIKETPAVSVPIPSKAEVPPIGETVQ